MTAGCTELCLHGLQWARERSYRGYSKFDALNSPALWAIAGRSRLLRSALVYGVSRAPVNIRPLLLVRKKQNPKGLALFSRAYWNLYEVTREESLKNEALRLLAVLLGLSKRDEHAGHCWGYDHPWQNVAFFIPPYEPNCVVTCAVASAFLHAYQVTGNREHLAVCESAADFILKDLTPIDVGPDMRCCSYDLHSSWKVVNVNALASAFLAELYACTQREECKTASQAMMRWVISQKTDYHAWYYTDPPEASCITHDNYHTGFVLDSIRSYLKVFPDPEIERAWRDGLAFYRLNLFTTDHAPKWMYNREYPHDIHGAAQGIITFSLASEDDPSHLDFATHVLDWTLHNLYDPGEGRFYYQKGKHWTRRFTLMRWSQAWMCYAVSRLLGRA